MILLEKFFKVAWRNYLNHKGHTLISIIGFSIGLTSFILIGLYVWNELNYDRFHPFADRMYRICFSTNLGDNEFKGPTVAAPMCEDLKRDCPEIKKAIRILKNENQVIEFENKKYYEDRYFYADPEIFDFFSFHFDRGDRTALSLPNTVVLSESVAKKYFGSSDPIGKVLKNNGTSLEVKGVVKDFPIASHFHFDFLVSMSTVPNDEHASWFTQMNYVTYIQLAEGTDPKALEAKFPGMIKKYGSDDIRKFTGKSLEELFSSGNHISFSLQRLTDIHLRSNFNYELEPNGSITYVYIFILVATLILLIACINFTVLATAKSESRSKEVGVRKSLGSGRKPLVFQFLGESIVLTVISVIISCFLAYLLFPVIADWVGLAVDFQAIRTIWMIPIIIGFALVVGVIAGSYPAFYLSSFNPIGALKGKPRTNISGGWLRNSLVVLQFTISIAIMLCTFIVYLQLKHLQNKELGFGKDDLIVLEKLDPVNGSLKKFTEELSKYPAIENVSLARNVPFCGGTDIGAGYQLEGSQNMYLLNSLTCDDKFARTMGLQMASGRYFSPEFSSDMEAIIVNESVVRYLGINDPIGKRISSPDMTGKRNYLTIIGVVRDFNFESPRLSISPMIIRMDNNEGRYIVVKAAKGKQQEALTYINGVWNKLAGNSPLSYFYFDREFNKSFKPEQQIKAVLSIFAFLSIVLASLGLFSLISYITAKRTKEIGVRKILGSSVQAIILLLSNETLKLIGLAGAIAFPLVWFTMNYWLHGFAYRIVIPIWIFFAATLIVAIIALTAIMTNVISVAMKNPTESLRYE